MTVYKIYNRRNYMISNAILNGVSGGGEEVYSKIYRKVNGELYICLIGRLIVLL